MNRTPAQLFALVVGAALVGAGIIGFFYNASFAVGENVPRDAVLGILDVNGWHNVVHIATGALGLATFASAASARAYAVGLGGVYLVVAIWGLLLGDGGVILNLVPVNTEDNILHVLIAISGIAAGLMSRATSRREPRIA